MASMVPRCPLWLFLPDHDRTYQRVPIDDLLPGLRREIHAVTGGDTAIACEHWNLPAMLPGDGRYTSPNGATMQEHTVVLLICLPLALSEAQRDRLLEIFVDYGMNANQEVVQVVVGLTTCWLPTGELIDAQASARERCQEVKLQAG